MRCCNRTVRKTNGRRNVGWLLAAVLVCLASHAQVQLGENLNMNAGGSIGFGYGGGFGSYGASSHSTYFTGNGGISGSYFHPNFLSFSIQPYYNRSQNNSDSQSVFDESGVIASTSLFSGSRFPGSIGFSKSFNGSGEFGLPGVAGLTTEGSARSFDLAWSALLPDKPTLRANFSQNGNNSTVVGTDGQVKTSSRVFSLTSDYNLAGFQLDGFYNHQNVDTSFPSFLGTEATSGSGFSSGYGLSAMHSLPLRGTFTASWSRTTYGGEDGGRTDGNTNTTTVGAWFNPINKLSVSGDFRYTGNVFGALEQSLAQEGYPTFFQGDNTSNSYVFGGTVFYRVSRNLGFTGHVSHREQDALGTHYSDTRYGGNVTFNYARPLLGMLYFSFGLVDTTNETGHTGLAFNGNLGITRKFGRWETSADFSYAQSVQTILAAYTTSNYTYGGFVRRKLNMETWWNASYRSARSALTQYDGTGNQSQTLSTGLSWRRYSVTGSYSTSSGTTLLSPSGTLTPTPFADVLTNDFVVFNGDSYGLSFNIKPLRRMLISGSWASVKSDTLSISRYSLNQGERYNSRLDYRLRKMLFRAGYSRTWQGISATGAAPTVINSYYFGISRWFDLF